jgi:GGDEF domain-containing protein
MRKNDVVGRVGGDEFVIFAYGVRTEETVAMLCKKIEKRFQAQRHEERILPGITVGGTLWQNDEDYTDMFERADQALLAAKERKRKNAKSSNTPDENWLKDMDQITEELAEQISMPGAFCQDFESFKSIYHFLERCMRRNNQKACLILMSLVELNGENILPHEKPEQMDALEEILRHTLRLGDVYTRYSCCQFLVLLMDTTGEQAERVALRVKEAFHKRTSDKNILFLYCHELHSARLSSQNYPDSCDRLDL